MSLNLKTGEGDQALEDQEGPAGSAARSPFSQPVHLSSSDVA